VFLDTYQKSNSDTSFFAAKYEAFIFCSSRMTNTLKIQDFLRYLEEKYLEDGSSKLPGTSVTVYQPTQCHIPKDLNLHQPSYENLVSHTIIQPYQLAKTVCTCLPLQMTNLMTGSNITLCRRRNLYGQ